MADERNLNEINEDLINNSNDLLDIHNALNDVIKEEASNEESIKNTIDDINAGLDSMIEKKTDINDINSDIINSERDINNNISNQNNTLTNIVDARRNELSNVQQTVLEQQKLYGFTTQVLTNLQSALATQQQLNAAIAAGANTPTPSGGTPPTPPTSGGTPPTPPTSGGTPSTPQNGKGSSGWFDKGKLAKSTFQGSIDLVIKYGKEAIDKWREIDRHVYTTGRQMGMTTTQMRGLQKNILENYGEMANRLGMTFEEIFKFQESYTQSVGRSVILTNKQVESFAGLSKIMGETAVNDMAKNMDDFGASSQTAIDYLTLGMARAANQGLNIKSTSESFAKNIKMASRFTFSKGVDGISKMTLLSQRLKFNMESIGGAIDKFSTIEGAITSSANLQVLGGAYAANYSNPLQAMGEALLDAEGFTNRIVDTVSKTAFFDKDSGMVKMSPIDKAKMREASKIYGIDYNELWNMASQQAKMRDIDKYVSGKGFTEEQKTFLANTAQYDAKTGAWTVTKMNEDGKQSKPINISNISSEELTEIQQQNDVEKSIQGDVHSIRNKLEDYLSKTVYDTKTFDETVVGQNERVKVEVANFIDDGFFGKGMKDVKDLLKDMKMSSYIIAGAAVGIFSYLTANAIGKIGDKISGAFGNKGKPSSSGGSSIFKHGIGRGLKRGAIKMFGKGGAKALGKSIPYLGAGIMVLEGGIEGYNAISKHSENVKKIESDNTMTQEEKNKAIHESKKERNENVGGAIGGTSGALGGAALGASIGSVVPVVGTAIGGLIGGIAGWWLGDKAGRAVGNVVTNDYSSSRVVNNKTNNNAKSQISSENNSLSTNTNNSSALSQVSTNNNVEHNNNLNDSIVKANDNKLLSMIQEDVRKIRLNTNPSENTFVYSNSIMPKNQYETKTYIKEITPSQQFNQVVTRPKIEKIDLNISGTLKVQSSGKSQNIDINEIFQSPEFQRMLINKINEGFSRNGNVVQTRSLDSTQAIMGGYFTPNQLNSKN